MKPVKMFVMFGAIAFHFPEFANAQDAMEYEAVRNHVSCYPFGIDKFGQRKSGRRKRHLEDLLSSGF